MTELLTRPDVVEDVITLEEGILDDDVLCMTTFNFGPPCRRPALWRIFWNPFPCSHHNRPGLVCERHRDTLTNPPFKVACRTCRATWPSSEYVNRVEAL